MPTTEQIHEAILIAASRLKDADIQRDTAAKRATQFAAKLGAIVAAMEKAEIAFNARMDSLQAEYDSVSAQVEAANREIESADLAVLEAASKALADAARVDTKGEDVIPLKE